MGVPQKAEINLGLAVSGALCRPGQTRTRKEIAAFAGCSLALIYLIEIAALKKIRNALLRDSQKDLRDELHINLRRYSNV